MAASSSSTPSSTEKLEAGDVVDWMVVACNSFRYCDSSTSQDTSFETDMTRKQYDAIMEGLPGQLRTRGTYGMFELVAVDETVEPLPAPSKPRAIFSFAENAGSDDGVGLCTCAITLPAHVVLPLSTATPHMRVLASTSRVPLSRWEVACDFPSPIWFFAAYDTLPNIMQELLIVQYDSRTNLSGDEITQLLRWTEGSVIERKGKEQQRLGMRVPIEDGYSVSDIVERVFEYAPHFWNSEHTAGVARLLMGVPDLASNSGFAPCSFLDSERERVRKNEVDAWLNSLAIAMQRRYTSLFPPLDDNLLRVRYADLAPQDELYAAGFVVVEITLSRTNNQFVLGHLDSAALISRDPPVSLPPVGAWLLRRPHGAAANAAASMTRAASRVVVVSFASNKKSRAPTVAALLQENLGVTVNMHLECPKGKFKTDLALSHAFNELNDDPLTQVVGFELPPTVLLVVVHDGQSISLVRENALVRNLKTETALGRAHVSVVFVVCDEEARCKPLPRVRGYPWPVIEMLGPLKRLEHQFGVVAAPHPPSAAGGADEGFTDYDQRSHKFWAHTFLPVGVEIPEPEPAELEAAHRRGVFRSSHGLALTAEAQDILSRSLGMLDSSRSASLLWIDKPASGCGASALAAVVACNAAASYPVVWLSHSMPGNVGPAPSFKSCCDGIATRLAATTGALLVVVDDGVCIGRAHGQAELVRCILEKLERRDGEAPFGVLVFGRWPHGSRRIYSDPIEPMMGVVDVPAMAAAMQKSFPSSQIAVEGWAAAAANGTERDLLHKMLPVLSAVRGGKYEPLSSLVREAWVGAVTAGATHVLEAFAWITLYDASEGKWLGKWHGVHPIRELSITAESSWFWPLVVPRHERIVFWHPLVAREVLVCADILDSPGELNALPALLSDESLHSFVRSIREFAGRLGSPLLEVIRAFFTRSTRARSGPRPKFPSLIISLFGHDKSREFVDMRMRDLRTLLRSLFEAKDDRTAIDIHLTVLHSRLLRLHVDSPDSALEKALEAFTLAKGTKLNWLASNNLGHTYIACSKFALAFDTFLAIYENSRDDEQRKFAVAGILKTHPAQLEEWQAEEARLEEQLESPPIIPPAYFYDVDGIANPE